MSDNSEASSFAAASSGKSPEEVAFELLNKLKGQGVWGEKNMGNILDMYAECLDAAKGLRVYEGQNRVEVPIKGAAPAQAAPQQAAPMRAAPVQAAAPMRAMTPPAPMQAAPAPQAQNVQAQQQALHQAFKPG